MRQLKRLLISIFVKLDQDQILRNATHDDISESRSNND